MKRNRCRSLVRSQPPRVRRRCYLQRAVAHRRQRAGRRSVRGYCTYTHLYVHPTGEQAARPAGDRLIHSIPPRTRRYELPTTDFLELLSMHWTVSARTIGHTLSRTCNGCSGAAAAAATSARPTPPHYSAFASAVHSRSVPPASRPIMSRAARRARHGDVASSTSETKTQDVEIVRDGRSGRNRSRKEYKVSEETADTLARRL